MQEHDDMEPRHLQQFQKMVQRHARSSDTLKKLKLERKYEGEAKRMQSLEKFKRMEQSRKASDAERGHKLTSIAEKLDQKLQQSEQKLRE